MDLIEKRIGLHEELTAAARGDVPVDLLIRGGSFLNVHTGEILKGNVAVHKGFVVGVMTGDMEAAETLDARGKTVIPAFIDPHVHIESSMVLPPAYAEVAGPGGTGTVFTDPHEIVNVMGADGFRLMKDNSADLPVRFFFDIPTCVPSKRGAETAGAEVGPSEIRGMADAGGRKLGELMSYPEIVSGDPLLNEIVKTGWRLGLPRDAHFPMTDILGSLFAALSGREKFSVGLGMVLAGIPGLRGAMGLAVNTIVRKLRRGSYRDLDTYLTALGITADHETYGPELQVKLDHGMYVMISSHLFSMPMTPPLYLQIVRKLRYRDSIGACTDDIWPDDIMEKKGLLGVLKSLVKHGIDPVDAIRFATINNARRLAQVGIREASLLGAVAPGMVADLVLVRGRLRDLDVDEVIHDGRVVSRQGRLLEPVKAPHVPPAALKTVVLDPVSPESFLIPVPEGVSGRVRARVLRVPPPPALFPILTEEQIPVSGGKLDTGAYVIVAVFNRYGRKAGEEREERPGTGGGSSSTRTPSLGLVSGFGLRAGAVASTLAHDSHNLVVMGRDPEEMALAANEVIGMGGGMCAVKETEVLARLPFPVGGLMTTGSVEEIGKKVKLFRAAIASLGLDPGNPIFPFAIFTLPAMPGPKITDLGLWDGDQGKIVSVIV